MNDSQDVPRQNHQRPDRSDGLPPERAKVITVPGIIIMVIITGVLGLITSCKSASTSTSTPTPMPTPTAEPTPIVPTVVFVPAMSADDCRAARFPEGACTGVDHNDEWEPYIQNFNGVDVALVPAGCFVMGSGRADNEKPVHEICFDEPFWIDVYEITNEAFGSVGCRSNNRSSEPDQPRICVNWADALAHCESRGARLPTEAEWEYAARGPDGLVYPWGDEFVADNAVHSGNSGGPTSPVGSRPGGMSWVGAYDLSGNVWEWVNDWYDPDYYTGSPAINPQGPESGTHRVVRGGAYDHGTSFLRSAIRRWNPPSNENINFGFRCARDYRP